jgi:hypothetical protein
MVLASVQFRWEVRIKTHTMYRMTQNERNNVADKIAIISLFAITLFTIILFI